MENYRKIELVGKGSYGQAVLVQNIQDRKFYIMKIIDVSLFDRKQKEDSLNEVAVLKELQHPFITRYRESFVNENRYLCIVMDYADDGTLDQKIQTQKKKGYFFDEDQVLDWFVQLCLGLKNIHDKKIIHRDIKTQNIFLTTKGEVKIGDFGISKILRHTSDLCKTAIGTPYYISPEICQHKPYNQKSDIWSLGCILYELLSLRHAFDAKHVGGLIIKIMRGQIPRLSQIYSQDIRDLITQLLAEDPEQRLSVNQILEMPFLQVKVFENKKFYFKKAKIKQVVDRVIENARIKNNESQTLPKQQKSQLVKQQQFRSDGKLNFKNDFLQQKFEQNDSSRENNQLSNILDQIDDSQNEQYANPQLSIADQIELIRIEIEQQIDMEDFIQIYQILQDKKREKEEQQLIKKYDKNKIQLVRKLIELETNIF